MNSLFSPTSILLPSPRRLFTPHLEEQPQNLWNYFHHYHGHRPFSRPLSLPFISHHSLRAHKLSVGATSPPNEGAVSVINFEDFVEKDWSFLDSDNLTSGDELNTKIDRIISAGKIEGTSKVLVSLGSEGFVDRLVETSPCELICLPEKWAQLDVVFLYFLPALPFKLDQVFGALAKRCLPGARVVISHPRGREVLKQQQQQHPDVIISDLPDKMTLQKVTADHSFDMVEFVDEPGFYLAVLQFS